MKKIILLIGIIVLLLLQGCIPKHCNKIAEIDNCHNHSSGYEVCEIVVTDCTGVIEVKLDTSHDWFKRAI
jgi:hypothetical protein